MIDVGLIPLAKKAIEAKPRHFITVPQLLAVVQQESHGVPFWIDTKPGSLYSANVTLALNGVKWVPNPDPAKRKKQPRIKVVTPTGFTRKDIEKLITIPEKVGDFAVPKQMVGKLAKFRFEQHWWHKERFNGMKLEDKFYMCSSWGLVQFMGPNISKNVEDVKRFAADVNMQLLYAAGMLDDLLVRSKGSLHGAYKGYNSGDVNSTQRAVIQRADAVVSHYNDICKFLQKLGG